MPCEYAMPLAPPGYHTEFVPGSPCGSYRVVQNPGSGATSVVNQPPATPVPLPPAPSVSVPPKLVSSAPDLPTFIPSPRPAPTVATNQVVPLNDGSGNYRNLSTGEVVPASAVAQNLATMQLTAPSSSGAAGVASSALTWLEQNTIFAAVPNWAVVGGGLLALLMFKGKR
jgi:hypothetical protein